MQNFSFTQDFAGFVRGSSDLHRFRKVFDAQTQYYTGFCRVLVPLEAPWELPAPAGRQYVAPSRKKISNLIARRKISNPSAAELVSSLAPKSVLEGYEAIPLCLDFRPQQKIVTKKKIII